jgi:serpin B
MKKIITLIAIIIFSFISCDQNNYNGPEVDFNCSDNEKVCDLANYNNEFGFDIFKKIHIKHLDENVFISPFSISTALSMAVNGAVGVTKDEMMNILHYHNWNLDSLNTTYKNLLEVLPYLDNKVKMKIANSIWYRNTFNVLPEFLDVNKKSYSAEIRAEDFSDQKTKDVINKWVEDKTEGKIKDILDGIDSDMVMFLINAIYFKGDWKYQFDENNTTKSNFILEDGKVIKVDMMSVNEMKIPYFTNDKFKMIDLPYGDSIYSMTIILPHSNNTVDAIISDLNITKWDLYLKQMIPTELPILIPKFKIEFKEYLKNTLIDLGMEKAFTISADFSKINGVGGLLIDDVIHQSFVEVDEKGTEAAAATVVIIKNTSIDAYFNANRPFIFVIKDNKTNSISFIGKVMNPIKNK